MTYIKTIPMLSGYEKAFQIKHTSDPDVFYFFHNAGISSHPSEEHIIDYIRNESKAVLSKGSQAIQIAQKLCKLEGMPDEDLKYIMAKISKWTSNINKKLT